MSKKLSLIALILALLVGSVPCSAQTITYLTTLTNDTDTATFNAIGDVVVGEAGLLVLIPVATSGTTRTLGDLEIDDVDATVWEASGASNSPSAIAGLEVSAGTYTIDLAWSGSVSRTAVHACLVTGYASATPVDTATVAGAGASSMGITLNYPAGGGKGFYGHIHSNVNATGWSAADEDHDAAQEAVARVAAAHKTASGASNTETISWTSNAGHGGAGGVWEPAGGGASGGAAQQQLQQAN